MVARDRRGAGKLCRFAVRALASLGLAALIAIPPFFAAPVAAQEEQRAGLVIVHGDGSVATRCITFAGESISGAELLARSGFDLSIEASSMGATICRIDGEGCTFPGEACFCQCQGSPCIYWSYWRLDEGEWRYSNLGAGNTVVRAGDVDGWRWGQGAIDKAEAPPALTFQEICTASDRQLRSTATPAPNTASLIAAPPTTPRPVATLIAPRANTPATAPTPLAALGMVLGVLMIPPAAVLLWRWLRLVGKERKQ